MKSFKVSSLGQAWITSLKEVIYNGTKINDGELELYEVCNLNLTIEEISHDDKIINQYADSSRIKLMEKKYSTCGLVGDYKIDYGSYIYNNNNINQVDWLIKRLRNKPETKSATISLHKPGEDLLSCLSLLDFKIRDSKLNMVVVYRSQNIFASQPGNLLALRKIQSDISDSLNIQIGNVELIIISAHIYNNDLKNAKDILQNCIGLLE